MSASPYGFALRKNGTCLKLEEDCGTTVDPYHVCCPESSFCPKQYNANCCPSSGNCTESLVKQPKCANETWDLYDNNGYFCCLPGHKGYKTGFNSDGCAGKGYQLQSGEVYLDIISAGITSSSTESSTSEPTETSTASSEATTEPSSDNNSSDSSSTNVGAIAGGVVGGVAGIALIGALVWFFLRKKKRNQSAALATSGSHEIDGVQKTPPVVSELPGYHGRSELQG